LYRHQRWLGVEDILRKLFSRNHQTPPGCVGSDEAPTTRFLSSVGFLSRFCSSGWVHKRNLDLRVRRGKYSASKCSYSAGENYRPKPQRRSGHEKKSAMALSFQNGRLPPLAYPVPYRSSPIV
jgi:hypothetical protein